MSIVRWSPVRDMLNMQADMNRLFGNMFDRDSYETSLGRGAWNPVVDITETADEYQVTAELPGLNKDDVKISYEGGVVTIRGEKKQEKEDKNRNYHRVERSFGMFERSFRLPTQIDVNKIEAKFKDGILGLRLPKSEEARPKEIPIKIS
ncbi:Hsp20/alpha crystallin family protein [candidate division KSB1 bacterium]|nr:Hsp20/alpha crystallin family protein [candidate division KSB1 bacterium]